MHYKQTRPLLTTALAATLAFGCAPSQVKDDSMSPAQKIARQYLIADTHIDVPYRLQDQWADVTEATADGDFDFPRARAGGLDVVFMSIYTPAVLDRAGGHWQLANELIDTVEAMVGRAPDRFSMAHTADQAQSAFDDGRIALALGMENGSPIGTDLANVQYFYDRGIRYVTLAHSMANEISDSSYDENRPNGGLSEFGVDVVKEMNRLGMMVDVSHLTDEAISDVLEVSQAPVIASHSSVRHYTPDWERNISDELIRGVAAGGGVIHINFGSSFLTTAANQWYADMAPVRAVFREENDPSEEEEAAWTAQYLADNPFPFATIDDVVDHIDHVVNLVGIDYVGLGSDYDGVGDSLPTGLKSVADFPNLIERMLERGYSEPQIAQVLGGNLMRAWRQVEAVAAAQ
ncbi:MAG: dipeptidase [Lysobacteraceae bacterium]|nr:MAG: dipeptidase [Xanthomonadaceae bacterium]